MNLVWKILLVVVLSMPVYADIELSRGLNWEYISEPNSGVTRMEPFNISYIIDLKSESKKGQFQVFWAKLPDNISVSNSELDFTIGFSSIWTVYNKQVNVFLSDGPYDGHHQIKQIGEFVLEENNNAVNKNCVTGTVPENFKYLQFRIYDDPNSLDLKHTYQIVLANLCIGNPQDHKDIFDKVNKPAAYPTHGHPARIKTSDNLSLEIAEDGRLVGVNLDDRQVLNSDSEHTGILVRDVRAGGKFEEVLGKLTKIKNGVNISSNLNGLNLNVDANIVSKEEYIEISGVVSDISKTDRAITVYFGIPLADKDWNLADGIDSEIAVSGKNVQREYIQTLYPISAISNKKQGGLTLAIRMDEPRNFRFGYNTLQNMYFAAMDFALVPINNVHNISLSKASFRILLYRNSSQWAFRSALEKYYQWFPQFFNHRVQRPGGWGIPAYYEKGASRERLKQGYDMGMRYSWGHRTEMLKLNNDIGIYNILYIEPEYLQVSMGDYGTIDKVTDADVMKRLERLAENDPCEMEKYKKLHACQAYSWFVDQEAFPKWGGTADEYTSNLAKTVLKSLIYDYAGRPVFNLADNRPWLGDGNFGAMVRCDLDPDIENGKGAFSLKSLNVRAEDMQLKNHCLIDGVGLDCWLPMGDDYRKENFKYSDLPLSFRSEFGTEPMIPVAFSSIEWLRWMRTETQWKNKIFMANLQCNYMYYHDLFSMMYLDVLGIEDRAIPNPDFFRILGYHKSITDLPCGAPASEREMKKRLLQCIFPGYGHNERLLLKYSPIFEKLALAGWEPVPYVVSDSPDIRIERYGKGFKCYIVVHNNNESKDRTFTLKFEKEILRCQKGYRAMNCISGKDINIKNREIEMKLDPLDTTVLEIEVLNK